MKLILWIQRLTSLVFFIIKITGNKGSLQENGPILIDLKIFCRRRNFIMCSHVLMIFRISSKLLLHILNKHCSID